MTAVLPRQIAAKTPAPLTAVRLVISCTWEVFAPFGTPLSALLNPSSCSNPVRSPSCPPSKASSGWQRPAF